jgi:hypothetical protein
MNSKVLYSFMLLLTISQNVRSTCLIKSTTAEIKPTTTTISLTNPSITTTLVIATETVNCANCANIQTQRSKQSTTRVSTSEKTSNQQSSSSSVSVITTTPCINCNIVNTSKRPIVKTTFEETTVTTTETTTITKTTTESTTTTTKTVPTTTTVSATTTTTTTITTTQPIIITTTVTISPLDQCVHYSAAEFKISRISPVPSKLLVQIIPTSNDNPVPCCRACNLQPGCAMYSYAIKNQNNAVCSLYTLPSNLGKNFAYYPFLTRTGINQFVGFSYNFIGFF